ncbi:MAG: hypothetical protein EP305_00050 [Bacteroidetes bacterium]|nr:MAG: hypothetical protein EP305_00050 [Bacteroidota bacterium]
MTVKSIDINQRIPLSVLETALITLLNDQYEDEYMMELMSVEFTGENRIKKALRIVNKIILNSPIKQDLLDHKEEVLNALRNRNEKNVILISLLNAAFPFSFEVLENLGKLFGAQSIVSRDALRRNISKVYGSNRATENAIDSIIPMFLDADLFSRPKIGIYEFQSPIGIYSQITYLLYSRSFEVNSRSNVNPDNYFMQPYFLFVQEIIS